MALSTTALGAPDEQGPASDADAAENLGYFFGYSFGNMLKDGGNSDADLEALKRGMRDSFDGKPPGLTQEAQEVVVQLIRARQQEVMAKRQAAEAEIAKRQDAESQTRLADAVAFLSENAVKEGVMTTASGLQYLVLEAGEGDSPSVNNRVVVHYEGRLTDESVFDSSRKRGEPAEFGLGQVIPGWTEGLQLMKPGGKTRLFIPPDLGYGPGGTGNIPPNSVLIFDVELIEVK